MGIVIAKMPNRKSGLVNCIIVSCQFFVFIFLKRENRENFLLCFVVINWRACNYITSANSLLIL